MKKKPELLIIGGPNGCGKSTIALEYSKHLGIRIRVKKGGHNVLSEDVERRYKRSIRNFWKKYRFIADSWQILYNGKNRPIEIAINENEIFTIFDEEYFQIFKGNIK